MRRAGNIENCKSLHSLTLLRHVICCSQRRSFEFSGAILMGG